MKVYERKSESGLTMQLVSVPGFKTIIVQTYIAGGAQFQTTEESGFAHFLEHMFFRGSRRYPTAKDRTDAVDAFGGVWTGYTNNERCWYFIQCQKSAILKAMDILSDMMMYSFFRPEDIETEKGVVIQEIAKSFDMAEQLKGRDFSELIFPNHPFGRNTLGEKESVENITQEKLLSFFTRQYGKENIIVSLSGNIQACEKEKYFDLLNQFFSFPNSKPYKIPQYTVPQNVPAETRFHFREKETEQYHIKYGFPVEINIFDKKFPAYRILTKILSRRIHEIIRNEKGWSYSIGTGSNTQRNISEFATGGGIKTGVLVDALKIIRDEHEKIRKGVTNEEFIRNRNWLQGVSVLQEENLLSIAEITSTQKLFFGKVELPKEKKKRISATTKDEVDELAAQILHPSSAYLAIIGPPIQNIGNILTVLS